MSRLWRRGWSIRASLLAGVVVILLALFAGTVAVTAVGGRRTVEALSHQVVGQSLALGEEAVRRFLAPVANGLLSLQAWAGEGVLDLNRQAFAETLLTPLLTRFDQVSSVVMAGSDGRILAFVRGPQGWAMARGGPDGGLPWAEAGGPSYDPRREAWYEGALALAGRAGSEAIYWGEPQVLPETGQAGITAAAAVAGGGTVRVIALQVGLETLSRFTTELAITPHGGLVVLGDDLRLVGLPRHPRYQDPEALRAALLRYPWELDWALASDASTALQALGEEGGPTRFTSEGDAYWGQRRAYRLGPGRQVQVVVVFPESDLLAGMAEMREAMVAVLAVVLALALALTIVLARKYAGPVEQLVEDSERISRGDLRPGEPVDSPIRELRRLGRAHERMRQGLESLLQLEREVQVARQIQQAALPSRLPQPGGMELAAWSEPAQATGGDTYDAVLHCGDGDQERLCLLLADATGHGLGPALSATQLQAMWRMALRTGLDIGQLALRLNQELGGLLRQGRFVTAWFGELSIPDRRLVLFSAGQAPILHYHAAGRTVARLGADVPPLGVLPDLPMAVPRTLQLAPGDVVAVVSDGVCDARDPDRASFGVDRVEAVLTTAGAGGAVAVVAALREALGRFTGPAPAHDDRTALVVSVRKGLPWERAPAPRAPA